MSPNASARCPICSKEALPPDENPAAPFCSARCRLIDLGNWLGGAYRVPAQDDEEREPASEPTVDDDLVEH